jgi:hypothetical protein
MNFNYDDVAQIWNSSIIFEKNSTQTFKSESIFTFEKVAGSDNTLQAYLNKFQVFNTNGLLSFPIFDAVPLVITNIIGVNAASTYSTKWVYAAGIELTFYPGMWVYFTGLDGFLNTDFDTVVSGNAGL